MDLGQDLQYSEIVMAWSFLSLFSTFNANPKKIRSNKPVAGLLFAAGAEEGASGLLLQFPLS